MTHMQIFALYGALSGLILLALAIRVSLVRRKHATLLGDGGGNTRLLQTIRAHGNATEYIPIVLVLLLGLATMRASTWLLHAIGLMLVFGRILHAIGMYQSSKLSVGRGLGMVLTWLALLVAIVASFFQVIRAPGL